MVAATLTLASFAAFASGVDEGEWPTRPIDLVVGWSAGGTSDTTARALAREMSDFLGVEIRVLNMPGANGGLAYQNVYDSPADGYRWFGGAQVMATYPVTEQARVGWEEFYPFPAGMGGTTIYVLNESPYEDLADLVEAIDSAPNAVKYGTTSRGGNGSIFASAFVEAAGIADNTEEVPYDGGREAGFFLLSGEVEFVSVSLGDLSDWAEGGQIRPLANLFPEDYEWRGITFPSIGNYYPELVIYTAINPYWGISVRRETPPEIVERIVAAFEHAVEQQSFQDALYERGIIVAPLTGQPADEAIARVGSGRGWPQYELGIVNNSPAEFDIPRITEFSWPPNAAASAVVPWPAGDQ
ncbi:MAG: tripartite tricarboxylate transporter substrate binding protein [Spirochaetales bacterium]|nr:tripartite tricarboxylate transporter substrate binding protein [Spirochaetales bacterium]